MKAIRLLEYGGQLVFDDVPRPTIASDEILVKVRSTAVNHLDLVEASGTARQILPIDLPWIPGHEFSGVVEQIDGDVAPLAAGDAVFGITTGMGAYAEYVAVKAAAVAKNHGISHSETDVPRRKSHGKIVLRVASREHEIRTRAFELFLARGAQPGREMEDWLQAERELTAE